MQTAVTAIKIFAAIQGKMLRIIKARSEDIRRTADMCLAYDVEDRKEEKTDETA